MNKTIAFLIIFFLFSTPSYAYLGPGLGLGLIVTVLGICLAVIIWIISIIWVPIQKILSHLKSKKKTKR